MVERLLPKKIDKRLVGEVVYQLEQRIFNFVFSIEPLSRRFIDDGYEPLNIRDTIISFSLNNSSEVNNECKLIFRFLKENLEM